ncbi:Pimeloyl-ACP methyl ester carboxylesterase [Pedobacter westerhofensis]|uniref:Pimeloyl-ACP methyl ester carboxylesterase n=1 Tax=Pedobacter westerhofensis TaxID=425512 RepID=A0A521B587_9SPHI|nr:alpha/beta fold hydrolase [Pedobacter westerhofensis]SMO42211.1 Pimeloyl-ACP methyl ester carboxylesterase [Pedobacter westerhofensis]
MNTNKTRKFAVPVMAAFILAFAFLLSMTGCDKDDDHNPAPPQTKTFVLVHGAFQGAYAWKYVKAQLEAAGQKVVVVELPGHGSDQTPVATLTLNSYRNKVISAITGISGKVVLVAHSAGGSVITGVADSIPEHIEKMVYIAAAIPKNGQSLDDIVGMDASSQLFPNVTPSADGLTGSISNDKVFSIFCQDGSEEVKQLLIANNRPEPLHPQMEKIVLKNNPAAAALPKYYIHTTKDLVAPYELQKKIVAEHGIKNVFTLDSGHCPFLSVPDQVTAILLQIIK